MNNKLCKLLIYELKKQFGQNSIFKYLLLYFIFCTFSVTLVNSPNEASQFGVIFSVISIPISMLSLTNYVLYDDIKDGTIESLRIIFSGFEIIIVKFIGLFSCSIIAYTASMLFVYFLFSPNFLQILLIFICGFILCANVSSLICLISTIQGYFKSNTNFLTILLMPLIAPSIILIGLALQTTEPNGYIGILLGINLVLIPLALYLASYLLDNIYNI